MPKKTSSDAKNFLAGQFPELPGKWKRISKRKQGDGRWVREFEHATGQRISLVEDASGFSILDGEGDSLQAQPGGMFSEEELDGARALLEEFRQGMEPDENGDRDYEENEHTQMRAKFAHALPGIMSFFFPGNTYGNPEKGGARPDMPANGLCVTFFETDKGVDDGYEYYYQWMIPEECTPGASLCDETNLEIEQFDGSASQFAAALQAIGFTHASEECVFGKMTKPAIKAPRQAAGGRDFSLIKQSIEALEKDDGAAMEALLTNGLKWNQRLGDGRTIVDMAIDRKAFACFEHLLARVDTLDADTERNAWMALYVQGQAATPELFYFPLISKPWDYSDMGGSIVHQAVQVAMDKLGMACTGTMLDIAAKHTTPDMFAGDLLRSVAQYPLSLRANAVKQQVARVIDEIPGVLVDEATSPIPTMIKGQRYAMAGDWIARYSLPVDALKIDGEPLIEVLENRLDRARTRLSHENANPMRVVRMDRNGQVMPEMHHIDVRDIPGLLTRLSRPGRPTLRPRP